jgi:HPt (histidine-containing phosphotransfer) domain-containing protein
MDKQKLVDAGINYDDGLKRFGGNVNLYEKFLKKFPADTAYTQLAEALKTQEYETAFKLSHTMKGTTGNLSMDDLYNNLFPLVEALRSNQYENVDEMMEKVTASYETVMQALEE